MAKKPRNNLSSELRSKLKLSFLYVVIFSFGINVLMLITPLYSLQVLDRVISSASEETLVMLTIIVVIFTLFWGMFSYVRDMILASTSRYLDDLTSRKIVHNVLDDISLSSKSSPSQNIRDLDNVKRFINSPAIKALFDFPFSVIFLMALYLIHPILLNVTIIGAVVILCIAFSSNQLARSFEEKASSLRQNSYNKLDSFITNATSIKALRLQNNIRSRWYKTHDENNKFSYKSGTLINFFSNLSKSIRMIVQIFITGAGGYLVLQNEMTPGGMIAASIIAGRALAPFDVLVGSWRVFIETKKSYKNLSQVIDTVEDKDTEKTQLPEPKGVLSFENVSFLFKSQEKPTIHGVNFTINKGDVVALIGPSASGKSTLASLAVGIFKPSRGNVRLDGADINYQDSYEFGQALGYLSQNVDIFNATVKENIARMNEEISDEQVVRAAKIAGVHEMILQFPQGYETIIGKSGMNLSAGQKQRIGLARCFYGNPKLLILDEPNANLDEIGDRALLQSLIYAKKQGITTLIITHRPSILQMTDKLLILTNGMVADYAKTSEIQHKYIKRASK